MNTSSLCSSLFLFLFSPLIPHPLCIFCLLPFTLSYTHMCSCTCIYPFLQHSLSPMCPSKGKKRTIAVALLFNWWYIAPQLIFLPFVPLMTRIIRTQTHEKRDTDRHRIKLLRAQTSQKQQRGGNGPVYFSSVFWLSFRLMLFSYMLLLSFLSVSWVCVSLDSCSLSLFFPIAQRNEIPLQQKKKRISSLRRFYNFPSLFRSPSLSSMVWSRHCRLVTLHVFRHYYPLDSRPLHHRHTQPPLHFLSSPLPLLYSRHLSVLHHLPPLPFLKIISFFYQYSSILLFPFLFFDILLPSPSSLDLLHTGHTHTHVHTYISICTTKAHLPHQQPNSRLTPSVQEYFTTPPKYIKVTHLLPKPSTTTIIIIINNIVANNKQQ